MDLSKVLGDVYETKQGAAPEWADEERLDEAFAEWTPGPPADAPAAEREMAIHVPAGRLDDDLAAALTEALAVEGPSADPVPSFPDVDPEPDSVAAVLYAEPAQPIVDEEPEPAAPTRWVRGDDDVAFANGRSARRSRFSRR